MYKLLMLLAALLVPAAVHASTPAAYAQLNRDVARACLAKSELARARLLTDRLSFSDAIPVELRALRGFDRRGRSVARVCAYDRRTKTAEVQDGNARFGGAR